MSMLSLLHASAIWSVDGRVPQNLRVRKPALEGIPMVIDTKSLNDSVPAGTDDHNDCTRRALAQLGKINADLEDTYGGFQLKYWIIFGASLLFLVCCCTGCVFWRCRRRRGKETNAVKQNSGKSDGDGEKSSTMVTRNNSGHTSTTQDTPDTDRPNAWANAHSNHSMSVIY
ncbi:predicted protein [Phaeodactylum tricornutum CCAP 1055/1]|uniref:Uncharacterized protein n=1 Tax=Phaeodactylum tricornutum (strain CCAP 1055/1) TaxID=556484 RepID=B7G5V0_PHATC|nr:predicted protein [Phaeodactylum tricornutum CCAP 1055/1]EEC45756.1 predicted protein [Phaeodactylum tricornutum CCAP 1055/1]|eukprot:XP_002182469.1 predicted protein [Phaeodactylum tricornutum CCAP 1055/1]